MGTCTRCNKDFIVDDNEYYCADCLPLLKAPLVGLYRLHNDVWEIKEFEGGDKYMLCHGDHDERIGKVPADLDINTLPNMNDYNLSKVEY